MSARWRVVTTHRLRRWARREQRRLEDLMTYRTEPTQRGLHAAIELTELELSPDAMLRVSPKRWRGYWRVEVCG